MLKLTNTMKTDSFSKRARTAVLASLSTVPFAGNPRWVPQTPKQGLEPDAHVSVTVRNRHYTILVEVKNNGQPRHAREAVARLLLGLQRNDGDYAIFVAPFISPRSAEICRENGIGFIDLAGNSYLSFDSIFIEKAGKPNPFKRANQIRSLFSPKAERILRVLLHSGTGRWKVNDLAEEADVSLGLVSNVKRLLEDEEWLGDGLALLKPDALLEAWTQNYTYTRSEVSSLYSLEDIPDIEARLDQYCRVNAIPFGLTGFSGAARYAPAVRYRQAMAFVDSDIEALAAALDLKPVDSGANVLILSPYDAGVFYGAADVDGSRVVSPIQVHLDLVNYRGRGEEAAAAVYEQVIRKQW